MAIMRNTLRSIIKGMPEQSYALVGIFNGKEDKWLDKNPRPCTLENKNWMIERILTEELADAKLQYETNPMEINAALKSTLEMEFAYKNNYQRSVILVSNGLFMGKDIHEETIVNSIKKRKCRISAIGIGNGSSDSFLRTMAFKGLGLFEVINSPTKIEEKIEFFMKRLRWYTIDTISFDISNAPNVVKIVPVLDKNQALLKGLPIEVFIYLKEKSPSSDKTMQSVTMHYNNLECNKREAATLNIFFKTEPLPKEIAGNLHKLMIKRLLNYAVDLKASNSDRELVEYLGEDWTTRLAVEHQVLTNDTSMLLVANQLPEGFDIMKDDISQLKSLSKGASKQVVVKPMLGSDSLAQSFSNNLQKISTDVLKRDMSKLKFTPGRCRAFTVPLRNAISAISTTESSNTNIRSTTSLNAQYSSTMTNTDMQSIADSLDANEILHKIYSIDEEEEDQQYPDFFKNMPDPSDTKVGAGKTKPHSHSHSSTGGKHSSLEEIKETSVDNEEAENEPNSQRKNDPMDIMDELISKGGLYEDPQRLPISSNCRMMLIVDLQTPEGNWEISENLLSILEIKDSDLEHLASEMSNNLSMPIVATFTAEDVLALLCVAYLELAKEAQVMRKANTYLLKTRKLSKIKDLIQYVSSKLMAK